MEQAADFRAECDALSDLLSGLDDKAFEQQTLFKNWTINDVIRHLHVWNHAAGEALRSDEAIQTLLKELGIAGPITDLREAERHWISDKGTALLNIWRQGYQDLADGFSKADPRARLKWAGPDMSARSSITARLMETWAHGQEVYDVLGVARVNEDRIRNIVVLGINTFGWTYVTRQMDVPDVMPFVSLQAPSGEVWEFGDSDQVNTVRGSAEAFCQVVAQVRNIADTTLEVNGPVATQWMSMAQCFAGGPSDPPVPGSRYTASRSL